MKPVSPYSRQTLFILLVLMTSFWGLNWPVMKTALHYFEPWFYVFLRMALGATVVGLYLALTGRWRWPTREAIIPIITVGLLQIAVVNYIMVETLQFVEAGRAAILSYSTPLWITPVAILVFKERYNISKILGVVLGLLGILVLFNPFTFDWHARQQVLASVWLLVASGIWGMCILLTREYKTSFPMLPMAFWQLLFAACVLMVPGLTLGHPLSGHWTVFSTSLALYTGILSTGFAYVAMILVSKYLPSVTISLVLLATPGMGMIFSRIFLNEPLTLTKIVAMTLIMLGVTCVLLADRYLSRSSKRSGDSLAIAEPG